MRSFSKTAYLSVFLTVAAGVTDASTLPLSSAYASLCNPVRVVFAATQFCAKKLPDRSNEFTNAYQQWLTRNESDLPRLKNLCVSEIRKFAADDTQFQSIMQELDNVATKSIEKLTKRNPENFCADALSGLESGSADLKHQYPPSE